MLLRLLARERPYMTEALAAELVRKTASLVVGVCN
jgi:hypothetical protein